MRRAIRAAGWACELLSLQGMLALSGVWALGAAGGWEGSAACLQDVSTVIGGLTGSQAIGAAVAGW